MNPIHLRTFLAVRKHLNYTRAAEEVFLSQPAVSRQIRQLERELGVPLFEQLGKSLHLTDAGRTLAREAERALLKAVKAKPKDPRVHMALSDLFVKKGDLRYATFAAKKAVELAPTSPHALNRLGRVQFKKRKYPKAKETFRKVLRLLRSLIKLVSY